MNNHNQPKIMEWLLIRVLIMISLQMQPSPFNKRYYATQNGMKNMALFTGQIHKYGAHLMLYYDTMKTQWLLYYKFTKWICVIMNNTCFSKCSGAVMKVFRSSE